MPASTRELVAACLAGDADAQARFVDRFGPRIFGLCLRMVGHRQDAEDLAQESLVRALRALDRWDCERDIEPWLLAIAGNRCRTFLAQHKRRPIPARLEDSVIDPTPPWQPAHLLAEELQRALAELRDDWRQAFHLYYEQELGYAEIAEAMECPKGTVKTWIHRARQEIIRRLVSRGVVEEPRNESRASVPQ